jgi:hypothetical protein
VYTSDEINELMMSHQQAYLQQDMSAMAFPQGGGSVPFADDFAATGVSGLANIGLPVAMFGATAGMWAMGLDPYRGMFKGLKGGGRAGFRMGSAMGSIGGGLGRGLGGALGAVGGAAAGVAPFLALGMGMDALVNFTAGNIAQGAFDFSATQSFMSEIASTAGGGRFGSQSFLSNSWGGGASGMSGMAQQALPEISSMGREVGLDVGGMIGLAGGMVSTGMVEMGGNPQEMLTNIRKKLAQVQEISRTLDLTLEESFGVIAQLQQAGVSSENQAGLGIRTGSLSALTGVGMPALMQAGSQAAQMGVHAGVSPDTGYAIGIDTMSSVATMSSLGMVDRNLLQMVGGPQGLSQLLTQATLQMPTTRGGHDLIRRMVDESGSGIDYSRMMDLQVGDRESRRRVDPYALPDLQAQFVEREREIVLGQVSRIQDRHGRGSRRANEQQYEFLSQLGIGDPRMQEAYLENLQMQPVMRVLEAAQSIVDDQQLAFEAQQRASTFLDRLFGKIEQAFDDAGSSLRRTGARMYSGLQGIGQSLDEAFNGAPSIPEGMVRFDTQDLASYSQRRLRGLSGDVLSRADIVSSFDANPEFYAYGDREGGRGALDRLLGYQSDEDPGVRLRNQGYSPEYLASQGIYSSPPEEDLRRSLMQLSNRSQEWRVTTGRREDASVWANQELTQIVRGAETILSEQGMTLSEALGNPFSVSISPEALAGELTTERISRLRGTPFEEALVQSHRQRIQTQAGMPEGSRRTSERYSETLWVEGGEGAFRVEELLQDIATDPRAIQQTLRYLESSSDIQTILSSLPPEGARSVISNVMLGPQATQDQIERNRENVDVVLSTWAPSAYRERWGSAIGPAGGGTVEEIVARRAQQRAVGSLREAFGSAQRRLGGEELDPMEEIQLVHSAQPLVGLTVGLGMSMFNLINGPPEGGGGGGGGVVSESIVQQGDLQSLNELVNNPSSNRALRSLMALGMVQQEAGFNPVESLARQAYQVGMGDSPISNLSFSTPWERQEPGMGGQLARVMTRLQGEGELDTERLSEVLFFSGYNPFGEDAASPLRAALSSTLKGADLPESVIAERVEGLRSAVMERYEAQGVGAADGEAGRYRARRMALQGIQGPLNETSTGLGILTGSLAEVRPGTMRGMREAVDTSIIAARARVLREDQEETRERFAQGALRRGVGVLEQRSDADSQRLLRRIREAQVGRSSHDVMQFLENRGDLESFWTLGDVPSGSRHLYEIYAGGIGGDVTGSLTGATGGINTLEDYDAALARSVVGLSTERSGGYEELSEAGHVSAAILLRQIQAGRTSDVSNHPLTRLMFEEENARRAESGERNLATRRDYARYLERGARGEDEGARTRLEEFLTRSIQAGELDPNVQESRSRTAFRESVQDNVMAIARNLQDVVAHSGGGSSLRVVAYDKETTPSED